MAQGYLYSKPLPATEFKAFAETESQDARERVTRSYTLCDNPIG